MLNGLYIQHKGLPLDKVEERCEEFSKYSPAEKVRLVEMALDNLFSEYNPSRYHDAFREINVEEEIHHLFLSYLLENDFERLDALPGKILLFLALESAGDWSKATTRHRRPVKIGRRQAKSARHPRRRALQIDIPSVPKTPDATSPSTATPSPLLREEPSPMAWIGFKYSDKSPTADFFINKDLTIKDRYILLNRRLLDPKTMAFEINMETVRKSLEKFSPDAYYAANRLLLLLRDADPMSEVLYFGSQFLNRLCGGVRMVSPERISVITVDNKIAGLETATQSELQLVLLYKILEHTGKLL